MHTPKLSQKPIRDMQHTKHSLSQYMILTVVKRLHINDNVIHNMATIVICRIFVYLISKSIMDAIGAM